MFSAVYQFQAMASDCAIHAFAKSVGEFERLAVAAEAEVRRIERRYSRYRDDSELSRINAAAASGGSVEIDAETALLITFAQACFDKSGGAFDITSGLLRKVWNFSEPKLPDRAVIDALLPRIGLDKISVIDSRLHFARPGMELDFGGLGKEYAADRAAEVCVEFGARHGFVDLAGDIRVIGPRPEGLPWMIGIRHPRQADTVVARVALTSGALATSGDYERFIDVGGRRYSHILDPRTGWPAQGLSSVTVISDRCLVAGSLSTAAMIQGQQGTAWLKSFGVRHIVIDEQGRFGGTEPQMTAPCRQLKPT